MEDQPALCSNSGLSYSMGNAQDAALAAQSVLEQNGPSLLLGPTVVSSVLGAAPMGQAQAARTAEEQLDSMQRLGDALQSVLSEGLVSDFVEGLKPVMHNGTLQISTYIQLAGEAESVFIGMFPDLQAAVNAQKQSQALVGKLPAPIARKLIEAQLAHTQAVVEAAASVTVPAAAAADAPGRWLSATSDITAVEPVRSGSADKGAADDATAINQLEPAAAGGTDDKQVDQQQPATAATIAAEAAADVVAAAPAEQQAAAAAAAAAAPVEAAATVANLDAQAAGTAAAATAQQATAAAAAAPGGVAGTAAPAGAAPAAGAPPLSALTDDVINLLLRKGLHALATTAQPKEGEAAAAAVASPAAIAQQQDAAAPVATAAVIAPTLTVVPLSGPLGVAVQPFTNEDVPYTSAAAAAAAAPGLGAEVAGEYRQHGGQADAAAAGLAELQQQYGSGYRGQPYDLPAAAAAAAAAAAGGYAQGQYGSADHMLEYAAPHMQMYRGQPALGLSGSNGLLPRPQLDAGWAAAAAGMPAAAAAAGGYAAVPYQEAYGGPDLYRMAGTAPDGGYAAAAAAAGGYAGAGYGRGDWSEYGGAAAMYGGAGAAGAAAAGGAGGAPPASAADLKRKRSDPRLNCIKSVQYRVSRFPSELHDMCIGHWERTRCARVVCNGVSGVMSVQGGRCVVSFTQHGQEVLKGVADYLRYAGEDRIKKWRRHVRMVDFPRPNNRTGELMTAEEFLCIVGYQSEQGGGKRPKYMAGAADGPGTNSD